MCVLHTNYIVTDLKMMSFLLKRALKNCTNISFSSMSTVTLETRIKNNLQKKLKRKYRDEAAKNHRDMRSRDNNFHYEHTYVHRNTIALYIIISMYVHLCLHIIMILYVFLLSVVSRVCDEHGEWLVRQYTPVSPLNFKGSFQVAIKVSTVCVYYVNCTALHCIIVLYCIILYCTSLHAK